MTYALAEGGGKGYEIFKPQLFFGNLQQINLILSFVGELQQNIFMTFFKFL